MAETPGFKVVIVGAGIAGLTLANILEKHDIDYILLEKHSSVVCEIGASIGLFPHGLRVLDQLGIYDAISEFLEGQVSIGQTYIRRADGSILTKLGDITKHMIRRHGYPFLFFDRQDLLKILYNNLKHKHRVLVNKAVSDIVLASDGVEVSCADGTSYDGTFVVGADGVHSSVRGIMRGLAAKLEPGYFDLDEEGDAACFYRCSFGIAQHVPGWPKGDQEMVLGDQKSQLVVTGPDDKVYWFLFERLRHTRRGSDIPRYSKDDEAEFFSKHRDLPITERITFGDVVKHRISSALTPLHEFVFKKWSFRRIVTIGDSAHKLNPISGHGGNIAIEACANLVNALMRLRDLRGGNFNGIRTEELARAFHQVESTRLRRAKTVVKAAHQQQALFAHESPIMSYLVNTCAMPFLGSEQLLSRNGALMLGGPHIKTLPVPRRPRAIPFGDELPAKRISNAKSQVAWLTLLAIMVASLILTGFTYSSDRFFDATSVWPLDASISERVSLLYSTSQLISPLLIYSIEGHRVGNQLTPLAFPILISCAIQLLGTARVAAVHAIFLPLFGHSVPTGRPVSPALANSLLPSLLVGYIIPALLFVMPDPAQSWEWSAPLWQLSPLLFNILVRVLTVVLERRRLRRLSSSSAAQVDGLNAAYHNKDIRPLRRAYQVAFGVQALAAFAVLIHTGASPLAILFQDLHGFLGFSGGASAEILELLLTPAIFGHNLAVLAVVTLCSNLYSIWDLRRVGYIRTSTVAMAAAFVMTGWLVVGPGATWAGLWYWREIILSNLALE